MSKTSIYTVHQRPMRHYHKHFNHQNHRNVWSRCARIKELITPVTSDWHNQPLQQEQACSRPVSTMRATRTIHVYVSTMRATRTIHVYVWAMRATRTIHVYVRATRTIHVYVWTMRATRTIHVYVCDNWKLIHCNDAFYARIKTDQKYFTVKRVSLESSDLSTLS